VYSQLQYTTV